MIIELEYTTEFKGATRALKADKNVKQKNAWHLKSVKGNGLPPTDALGGASYGLAGRSYNGLSIDSREIEAEMYADGFSPAACQQLLDDARRVVSVGSEDLGILKLTNSLGEKYRIAAKALELTPSKTYRRSALVDALFYCPYSYFEGDTLQSVPLFAVQGGKEYPLDRPYTFANSEATDGAKVAECFNAGDIAAPCTIKLFGAGLTRVEIVNQTTGAVIVVSGMDGVGGIEICTDANNLYARFDDGSDASAYVSLIAALSDFVLVPGLNYLSVEMTATSVTAAGTSIEWRGRYSSCL